MRTYIALAVLLGLTASTTANSSEAARSGPYSLELVNEAGAVLPTFQKDGRTYVLGTLGQRYSLHLRNGSGQRVELVASVDGRDVLDGRPSAWEKRGYLVEAYGDLVIDGFRLNNDSVAAFRFSSVPRSYAARMGDARDVGVIGVAVFPERPQYTVPPQVSDFGGLRREAQGLNDELSGLKGAPAAPVPAESRAAAEKSETRRGLGTEFGEQRESRVYETQFTRASPRPAAVLSLRYDDRPGLVAMGVNLGPSCDLHLRETAQPFRRDPPFAQPPPGWYGR